MTIRTRFNRWLLMQLPLLPKPTPHLPRAWADIKQRRDTNCTPQNFMRHYMKISHTVLGCGYGHGNAAKRRQERMELAFEARCDELADEIGQE